MEFVCNKFEFVYTNFSLLSDSEISSEEEEDEEEENDKNDADSLQVSNVIILPVKVLKFPLFFIDFLKLC